MSLPNNIKKPDAVKSKECDNAYFVALNAYSSVDSFFDKFKSQRRGRRGNSTDKEQDLLRAMIAFSGAGLDSTVKHLIMDTMESFLSFSTPTQESFVSFISKYLRVQKNKDDVIFDQHTSLGKGLDIEKLAGCLGNAEPRKMLIAEFIKELTSGSLQSRDAILKVAACFGIENSKLGLERRDSFAELDTAFLARNRIVHEMDIDFKKSNRSRYQRKQGDALKVVKQLLNLTFDFLKAVDNDLTQKSKK